MITNNQPENFDGLLAAWIARLDTEELNKRFFSEISNWYFWAVEQVRFPDDAEEDVEIRNATSVNPPAHTSDFRLVRQRKRASARCTL